MRVLEGEVDGEKAVTRHILEQTHRNGDQLLAVRSDLATMRSELATTRSELGTVKSRVDHVSGEVALIKGVLNRHTALLNVLVQDVGLIRGALAQREPPGPTTAE